MTLIHFFFWFLLLSKECCSVLFLRALLSHARFDEPNKIMKHFFFSFSLFISYFDNQRAIVCSDCCFIIQHWFLDAFLHSGRDINKRAQKWFLKSHLRVGDVAMVLVIIGLADEISLLLTGRQNRKKSSSQTHARV
jgi:hypothetical protein